MIGKILNFIGIGSGGGLIRLAVSMLVKAVVRTVGAMLTQKLFDKLAVMLVRETLTRISENTTNTVDDRLVELLLKELDERGATDAPPAGEGG